MQPSTPNYKKIYTDMIIKKYPEKMHICKKILDKEQFFVMDVILLNELITNSQKTFNENQKLKSYDTKAIFEILYYQKKHKLNNAQISRRYNVSRNTICKWKKMYFNTFLDRIDV